MYIIMSSNISFADFMGYLKDLDIGQLQSMRLALDNAISNKVDALTPPTQVNVNEIPHEPVNVTEFVAYDDGVRFIDQTTEDLLSAELESLNFNSKGSKNCVQNAFLSSVVDGYNWSSYMGTVKHGAIDMESFPIVKGVMDSVNNKLGTKLNSALVSY